MTTYCAPCLADLALVREAVTAVGGTASCMAHAVLLTHPTDTPQRRLTRLGELRTLAEAKLTTASAEDAPAIELLVQEFALAGAMDMTVPLKDLAGDRTPRQPKSRRNRPGRGDRPEGEQRGEGGERGPRPERGERGPRPERGERGPRPERTPDGAAGAAPAEVAPPVSAPAEAAPPVVPPVSAPAEAAPPVVPPVSAPAEAAPPVSAPATPAPVQSSAPSTEGTNEA